MQHFLNAIAVNPVIAAVRDEEALDMALASSAQVIFLLGSNILLLPTQLRRIRAAGKLSFMHLDLCEGLGRDFAAVDYVARVLKPDGVISTRAPLLKHASEQGLVSLQRLFLMDSHGLESGIKLLRGGAPDLVELMPGLVPKAIYRLRESLKKPIIAGGMVTEWAEVEAALRAGASAVSTSAVGLWDCAKVIR